MDHGLTGIIETHTGQVRFDEGRGYAEKDWGRSFPQAWIWAQCNSFAQPGVSVTVSVVRVPWLRSAFTGVIVGVLLDGRLFRFATYTGARLEYLKTAEGTAELVVADESHRLSVRLSGAAPGTLRSPVLGGMAGTVYETLTGEMHVTLEALGNGRRETLLDAHSTRAAVELMDEQGVLAPDGRD
jgi:hypothetical protein